jgi:ubiquinone/menaquinone biosynthesis C-methylase UbiE
MCDKYIDKEGYITAHVDIDWWKLHPNTTAIKDMIPKYMNGHLLDIGCNHGACTIIMAEHGVRVTGVDISKAGLEEGRNLLSKQSQEIQDRVDYVNGCLLHLPFEDNTFDGGFMFDVLEHIYEEDQETVLREISRVMKPGSYVYIIPPYMEAHNDPCHVFYFTEDTVYNILSPIFDVEYIVRDRPLNHDRLNCYLTP